jgi:hypothetical protein
VLDSVNRLSAAVLLGEGEPGEIGGVHGKADVAFGGELAEALTTPLLPGETSGERELERPMPRGNEPVEKGGVVAVLGRQLGDPEAQRGHAGESCQA